jgi:hypothetical protein
MINYDYLKSIGCLIKIINEKKTSTTPTDITGQESHRGGWLK